MKIYLVQSGSELEGEAGYSWGLLQANYKDLLVTFAEFQGKRTSIFRSTPSKSNGVRQEKHLGLAKSP